VMEFAILPPCQSSSSGNFGIGFVQEIRVGSEFCGFIGLAQTGSGILSSLNRKPFLLNSLKHVELV
jgi:hypothetical protein